MARSTICFKFPTTNKRICVPIPTLYKPFRPEDLLDWVSGLDDKLMKDLPVLATIDELAAHLSDANLRRTIQSAVQGGVTQPSLENVTINVGEKERNHSLRTS